MADANIFSFSNGNMRAIDRLLKVAGTVRKVRKEVEIKGEDFTFYMTPLTIAEQQAANKQARSDDATDMAIQLLIKKALDVNGQPMFQQDAAAILRNSVDRNEVEKLLLALISSEEEEEEVPALDMKSPDEGTEKGKRAAG